MFRNIVLLGDTKRFRGSLFNILTGTFNDNYDSVRVGHFLFINTFYRVFALPEYLPGFIELIKPDCIIITSTEYYGYIDELKELSRVIVYSRMPVFDAVNIKSTKYSCRGINNLLCEIACIEKKKHIGLRIAVLTISFLSLIVVCLYLLNFM